MGKDQNDVRQCKNCKYWEQDGTGMIDPEYDELFPDKVVGVCRAQSWFPLSRFESGVYSESAIVTGPLFGCVKFEKRIS